jgi:hypothetical protein
VGTTNNSASYEGSLAVVPSDVADQITGGFFRSVYVGGTGAITYDSPNGQTGLVLTAVPVGTLLPIAMKRIHATGTTATLMVGLY